MKMTAASREAFIRDNTAIAAPAILPELRLHLATEITPIWQATEILFEQIGIDPPFWAFAWAGGQGLARHLLDHPALCAGRDVLDFGAGSGLLAIAAARAGARRVLAADIDPVACTAMTLNAALNGVAFEVGAEDWIGRAAPAEIILAGDMCYERPLAERMLRWLRGEAARGVTVLLGDPGRTYRPTACIEEQARYRVPTSLELEDRTEREAVVWRLLP